MDLQIQIRWTTLYNTTICNILFVEICLYCMDGNYSQYAQVIRQCHAWNTHVPCMEYTNTMQARFMPIHA